MKSIRLQWSSESSIWFQLNLTRCRIDLSMWRCSGNTSGLNSVIFPPQIAAKFFFNGKHPLITLELFFFIPSAVLQVQFSGNIMGAWNTSIPCCQYWGPYDVTRALIEPMLLKVASLLEENKIFCMPGLLQKFQTVSAISVDGHFCKSETPV